MTITVETRIWPPNFTPALIPFFRGDIFRRSSANPMAPKPSAAKRSSHVWMLVGSCQRTRETPTERMMSTPPMVGVPAFAWCEVGVSSRAVHPVFNARSRAMTQGPKRKEISRAVIAA